MQDFTAGSVAGWSVAFRLLSLRSTWSLHVSRFLLLSFGPSVAFLLVITVSPHSFRLFFFALLPSLVLVRLLAACPATPVLLKGSLS